MRDTDEAFLPFLKLHQRFPPSWNAEKFEIFKIILLLYYIGLEEYSKYVVIKKVYLF